MRDHRNLFLINLSCGHKTPSAIGITDHVDFTNIEHVLTCISKAKYLEDVVDIRTLPGVELAHVPPRKIALPAELARNLGAEVVVVHGETPVGPVWPGTYRAALEAGVHVLAHPGFITLSEAELARENDVFLEIDGYCSPLHRRSSQWRGTQGRASPSTGRCADVKTRGRSGGEDAEAASYRAGECGRAGPLDRSMSLSRCRRTS